MSLKIFLPWVVRHKHTIFEEVRYNLHNTDSPMCDIYIAKDDFQVETISLWAGNTHIHSSVRTFESARKVVDAYMRIKGWYLL